MIFIHIQECNREVNPKESYYKSLNIFNFLYFTVIVSRAITESNRRRLVVVACVVAVSSHRNNIYIKFSFNITFL